MGTQPSRLSEIGDVGPRAQLLLRSSGSQEISLVRMRNISDNVAPFRWRPVPERRVCSLQWIVHQPRFSLRGTVGCREEANFRLNTTHKTHFIFTIIYHRPRPPALECERPPSMMINLPEVRGGQGGEGPAARPGKWIIIHHSSFIYELTRAPDDGCR